MRYFFDLYDGAGWARDDYGIVCNDEVGARRQAALALVEMAHDFIPSDGPTMYLSVRIRNAAGTALTLRLDFSTEAGPVLDDRSVLEHN
jgi:hypothetical protein